MFATNFHSYSKKMRNPITYFGGKGTMFKEIISEFPEKETYDTYIEPFGGSYSVGLNMPYIPPVEIYNDLDKNLYSLYKVLQDEELFKEFKFKCELIPYDDNFRHECRELLSQSKEMTLLDRAFTFFYANRTSFNGIGGFKLNSVIRRGTSKSISDFLSCVEGLSDFHLRFKNVVVCNTDGISLMGRFSKENVFMYLDPPYVQSTRTSNTKYKVEMDDDKQDEFLDACVKNKAKLLISGYDNEKYEILLDNGFTKKNFVTNNRIETLWKNF